MPRVYPRKGRNFSFTRQCGDAEWEDEADAMVAAFAGNQLVLYGLFNCEIAPTTGRRHLQGCFKLSGARSFDWVRENILTRGEFVEECRSWAATVKYCRKSDTRAPGTEPTTYGDVSESGDEKHGAYLMYLGSFYHDDLFCRELIIVDIEGQ